MKTFKLSLIFFFLSIIVYGQPVDSRQQEIVFKSVNVIPMDKEMVLENQTVVIKDGKIAALGNASKVKYTKNALVIDAKGKYLMPGIAEMHAHVPPVDDIEQMKEVLLLYSYHGVTTIRGMLGHPKHLELRSKIQNGEILGPHFYTTGPSFNGFSVKTAEAGAEMVRKQKEAGYDFLKLHPGLTKETFAAIAATANEVKIPFAGHVSFGVGVWRAIDAGYSSIDHLDGFIESLVPGIDTMVEQQTGLFGIFIADRADTTMIPKLIKALKEKNIWVVPTQALAERWMSQYDADKFMKDPEMKYMKKETLDNWIKAKNNLMSNPQFDKEKAERFIKLLRKLILACQRGGVGLLLGSDAPQVFNVPGLAAHRELEYLVGSGLTPYEALRTGTVNVATYLKKNKSGSIKVGNDADLILLNGNPLQDIRQSRNINGVMLGTKWLSHEHLAVELKKLEK